MVARIYAKELKRVIQALKPFTREGEYNKLMQYIHFEVVGNEIKFEALDGHRIAIEYLPCETDEDFKGYIKPMAIGKIRNDYCELELSEENVYLTVGDIRYRFAQPEGIYYDTSKLLNDMEIEKPQIVGVNAELLLSGLVYQNLETNGRPLVQLEIRGGKMPVIIRNCKDKRNIRAVLPINLRG
jgi:DNA polymerase III sliding clamp (beta) subunit (PCNA family)